MTVPPLPIDSGAAPLSNFKALHKLQKIHKIHKLHKTSKAPWVNVSSMKPKNTNPFRATFGAAPPLLVGRSDAIRDFGFALDEGPGAHERISLIIGPRGIGKTVLLNAFEDEALERGWLTLSDTATTGFVERLRSSIIQLLAKERKQLKGLNVSILGIGGGLNWPKRQNVLFSGVSS